MSTNWFCRLVQQVSITTQRRRIRRGVGAIEVAETRMLLSALAYSPKQTDSFAAAAQGAQEGPLFPLSETFKLHSLPGATKVIYLDFNGQVVTGTAWNSNGNSLTFEAYSFEGDASFTNNELEQLQRIWARVAEDFAPFNVNVTTEEPPIEDLRNTGGGDTRWGIRTLISSNDPLNTGAGGVAYIGSFNWDSDTPALVFNGGEKGAAETVSHEVGHTLFLGHDGRTSPVEEYYFGHGTGATSWGPIQGASFSPSLSQWSKGEYAAANNQEDDLNIITTMNGFGYRADAAGDSIASAGNITKLPLVGNQIGVDQKGIIEQRTDFDFYRLNVGNGLVTLNINGAEVGSNMDILAEVYDGSGNLVASSNPLDQINATISFTATLGAYYLKIDGVGMGNPLATGYTDYGSLGQYHITGSYVNPENSPPILNDQFLPNLKEGSPLGFVVGIVAAQESDENQTLKYEIIAGNTGGAFEIDQNNGRITIANPAAIDFEVSQEFRLTVKVTDNGIPVRSDTGVVTIRILDAVTYAFNSGVLTVEGTTLNDLITVQKAGTIKIHDGLSLIDTGLTSAQVTEVRIYGLQGNDVLRLDTTLEAIAGKLYGGFGEDSLISGLGTDLLDGGDGADEASYLQATSAVTVNLSLVGAQNTGGAGSDTFVSVENLLGSKFGDTLIGNALANVLRGGLGNDTLRGEGGADILEGNEGADSLVGAAGNDLLRFDNQDTAVDGGADVDTAILVVSTAAMNLSLLPGQLEILDASISTFNNVFDATGATWPVTITGGSGHDKLTGGDGNDRLNGGLGNDILIGRGGADRFEGGHGEDRIEIDHLDSLVSGGAGKDTVVVVPGSGPVSLNLGTGQIEVVNAEGSTQSNTFDASSATWNVAITGGSGADAIFGGSAVDTLIGGGGSDSILGNAGNDILEGGAGADAMNGGEGNDLFYFDNSDTAVVGGAGADTAKVKNATGGINLNLTTSQLETVNAASSSFANRFDATGADWIVNITGGSGDDTIIGGHKNDRLVGGGGKDLILGNGGNDILDGGAGIDTVSYSTATSRVEVNLATGRAGGGAGTDTLIGFENLTGSIFADTLIGNSGANTIRGGGGLDIINGGEGSDTIIFA